MESKNFDLEYVMETNYQNDLSFNELVMMSVVRAAENFKRRMTLVFKKYGLSFPQYNILRVLESSEKGQNKISVVGKIMLAPGANMTGLAKRLEQNSFIERNADPSDERVTLLKITSKGRSALKDIEKEKNIAIEKILSNISGDSRKEYLELTKEIIRATTLQ